MVSMVLVVGIAFAVLFARAAHYERMSPVVGIMSSIGITLIVNWLTGSTIAVILGQVVLFGVMWWYNAKRSTPPVS